MSPAPAAASFLHPARRRARWHSRDTPGLTHGRGPAGCPHPRRVGAHSYRAAPAWLASLHIMVAVPGGRGSRTMTAGMNSGCVACNPYPAPSCALRCCMPPRHRRPLHTTAATLYTPPSPPSTHCCHCPLHATSTAPMCHRRPHHWPLPLRVAPPSVAFMHMPHAARAPWGAHCCRTRLAHIHTSHMGPCTTPLCPHVLAPSLAPSVAVPCVLAPIACALASLAPSAAMPHVSAPIVCALASWAPSMAVPHISAPVTCALASWALSAAMRHDHMTVFTSCSCATGWHTCIGRAWETVDTL